MQAGALEPTADPAYYDTLEAGEKQQQRQTKVKLN